MIHETVIAAFVLVWLHAESGGGHAGSALETLLGSSLGDPTHALLIMGPHVLLWAGTWLWLARLGRQLDQGRASALGRADTVLLVSRIVGLLWHAGSVLALGWVVLVRDWIGNAVGLDELLAASPPIIGLYLGFVAFQPIEKRVRDATFQRVLQEGLGVADGEHGHPTRSRGAYVWFWSRQSVLPVLIPVACVFTWIEAAERVGMGLDLAPVWVGAVQFAGAAAMIVVSPLLLRMLWGATPMPESGLRRAVAAVCGRSAVRVKELLVWPTRGTTVNAAVLGFLPGTRFILFTDAMLERLGDESVEAVTAHEVGHVKERHLPWLALSTAAASGVLGIIVAWGASLALAVIERSATPAEGTMRLLADVLGTGVGLVTLAGAVAVFGWVSRRFEWQADAYAAADQTRAMHPGASAVSAEAAERVAEALSLVAAYNGIPPSRFGFRHGSIRTRQRKLRGLAGVPLARIPQNQASRRIKVAAVLGLAIIALAYASGVLDPSDAPAAPDTGDHPAEASR